MSRSKLCFLCAIFALSAATPAIAGQLVTDPNGIGGIYQGSTTYVGMVNPNLAGYIDFAVFAPGKAPVGFSGYTGYNPTEYLYTYQVFETGSDVLTSMTVALVDYANNAGHFTAASISGDIPSVDAGNPPTFYAEYAVPFDSSSWYFDGVSANTTGLAFQSPDSPLMTQATTIDGGTPGLAIPVPSPNPNNVPEPSTFVLALCAVAGLGLQWLKAPSNARTLKHTALRVGLSGCQPRFRET